jgi:MFS family permease
MVGFGETYFPAFALAVGLGELTAGLLSSVPLVAGGIMQTISPTAIRRLGSHKRWVMTCGAVQGLTFLPLVMAAWWGRISAWGVLVVAAVYWGAGLATGPAWNTWIGTIVPRPMRPKFFALRTRASQGAVLVGVVLGGVALQAFSDRPELLLTFGGLFTAAALCRGVSVWMLGRQSEPTPIPANMRQIPWREVAHHLSARSGGRLLVYLVAVQGAVQMAGPFFTPFMLQKLHLSYGQYVALIAVAFLSKIAALPFLGHVAHHLGARRLMWIGGIGIAPLSGGWLLSQHFSWLVGLQVAGGVTWAAYELAFFLLFFDSIPEEERTSMLTVYNLINTTAWVGGSLVGGLLLYAYGASYNGYLLIFGLSSVGRFLALGLLARTSGEAVEAAEIGVRTVAVRPNSAGLDAPVLPSLPEHVAERSRSSSGSNVC